MESKTNGKRKLCEEVEAGGSGKLTDENTGKKVDPGGDGVPKLKDPKRQMEEQMKVARGRPVKGKRKVNNWSNRKTKGHRAKNDIPPHQDVDNPGLDSLEQVEDVNEEVIEISSDDDETEEVIKISSDNDEYGGTFKISNNDNTNGEAIEGTKEEGNIKDLARSLEAQISDMSLDLECPVCLNVCKPPIYSCVAQHPVCSECRPNLKHCPVCRELYDQGLIRHRYAERDYEKLEDARRQLLTLQDPKIWETECSELRIEKIL